MPEVRCRASTIDFRRILLVQHDRIRAGLQVDSQVPDQVVRVGRISYNVERPQGGYVVKTGRTVLIERRPGDHVASQTADALLAYRVARRAFARAGPSGHSGACT